MYYNSRTQSVLVDTFPRALKIGARLGCHCRKDVGRNSVVAAPDKLLLCTQRIAVTVALVGHCVSRHRHLAVVLLLRGNLH